MAEKSGPGAPKQEPPDSEAAAKMEPDRGASEVEAAVEEPATSSPVTGAEGMSFQQLLVGAMASPAGRPRAPPIIAAVPMVAVPCFIAPAALLESQGIAGQFAMTHQAVLATVTAQAQMQLQAAYPPSPSSGLATSSFPQPIVSAISPVPLQQRPPTAVEDNVCTPEADQTPAAEQKSQSARIIIKAASSDGYNWRKYGQKQVKSSDRSRSYYKCTNTNCFAKKKVEHCQDGRVTEIVYRGVHNHDPPQKNRLSKEKGSQTGVASGENESVDPPNSEANEADPTTSKTEQVSGNETPERQVHCSSDCEEDAATKPEEDLEPDTKRRITESAISYPAPVLKTVKEPKVVVQTASDAGLVSDGYKWRKYGQKIVKGNPNPRSYYRCTHNGCPVRKHVERASEDSKSMVISYEGKHNHDLPTPKNGNDPSATCLMAAAAAVTNSEQSQSSDPLPDQKPSTESLLRTDGEITGKKTLESAQTLLSMGCNSTPGEGSKETSPTSIPRTIFSDNHAAVPVQNS